MKKIKEKPQTSHTLNISEIDRKYSINSSFVIEVHLIGIKSFPPNFKGFE